MDALRCGPQTNLPIPPRTHVHWFLLYPDDGRVLMKRFQDFTEDLPMKWIELLCTKNGHAGQFMLLTVLQQIEIDFSTAEQDSLSGSVNVIWQYALEPSSDTLVERRDNSRMPQEALWRQYDQWFAPATLGLTPQRMEVLGRRGRADDLYIIFGRET